MSYNVASFTEAQDRTIADVLRKMPGIEIEKDGRDPLQRRGDQQVLHRGMDMLDGRYSLATNNIAPQDVGQRRGNGEPPADQGAARRALQRPRGPELRLKKQARAHWTGTLRGAGGWSPDEVLGSGSAFAMRIAARSQSMLNLKGDNTGEDPTSDLRQLTVEEMLNGDDNRYEIPEWFTTGLSEAPLDDRRTAEPFGDGQCRLSAQAHGGLPVEWPCRLGIRSVDLGLRLADRSLPPDGRWPKNLRSRPRLPTGSLRHR